MQEHANPDLATWTELFVGGVPPLALFSLEALQLRNLVVSTAHQQVSHARKIAELALIGVLAQFEAFCKNQFAAIINIYPAVLQRFCASRNDTAISLEDMLAVFGDIKFRLGSLLSEKYDFGSAKTVNGLYLDLLEITPFSTTEIQEFDALLGVRNMLVHHGGVYTIKSMRLKTHGLVPSGRAHLDSVVVGPEYFELALIFLENIALKIAVGSHSKVKELLAAKQAEVHSDVREAINALIERPNEGTEGPAAELYTIYQSFELLKSANGVEGRLELLQDSRLNEYLRSILWNGASIDSLPDDHYYWRLFKDRPPQPTAIRVVDKDGNVLEKMSWERSLAKCDKVFLYPSKFPTFLLTVDFSIGMGSHAGPATSLVEISNGALRVVEALDDISK
jgi:hypothetical protein